IVNKLCKEGYIDDLRYTRAFIHDKLLFTDYGPLKLKLKLYYLGVDKNIIEDEINKIDNEIFKKKIIKLINKNKKLNYIINQGYSYEDIKKATNDC
ncbi:MAG: RecX family transcriptional regulator, partial [Bacilli bacterium]|nr:RecX family transcriptional regulator [Bacilli bacterium]